MQTEEIKTFYNQTIPEKYAYAYEHKRWFSSPLRKAGYDMTREVLERALGAVSAKRCVEVGPGPGTWTKLLLERFPKAHYDLVDISREMLYMAEQNVPQLDCVHFHESDFSTYTPVGGELYDLFFSVRAFEYFPDKPAIIKKIYALLSNGGRGIIITKSPKYTRSRLLGKKIGSIHHQQISPWDLRRLLSEQGFRHIRLYPAIINAPLVGSASLSRILYRMFNRRPLGRIGNFFAESYCITFEK